jgi:hypothetical protein
VGLIKRHARRLLRQKVRKPARAALRGVVERWCPECQKRVQPFHLCAPRSDFKARRAQHERAQRRRGGGTRPRERREHDYRTCRDEDCPRGLCRAFREGMRACPLPHQG